MREMTRGKWYDTIDDEDEMQAIELAMEQAYNEGLPGWQQWEHKELVRDAMLCMAYGLDTVQSFRLATDLRAGFTAREVTLASIDFALGYGLDLGYGVAY